VEAVKIKNIMIHLTKYYLAYQIKNEMGVASGMYGGHERCI